MKQKLLHDLPQSPLLDRVWAKVEVGSPDECWPFLGSRVSGYGRIGLGTREQGTTNAHVVVTEACHGPKPEPGSQARHLCGNRSCCNPDHLAWGSQSQNEMDKVGHGRSNRGERHGMNKLTADAVKDIRRRCSAGATQRSVANEFGICQQTVSEIVTGRTWRWFS